MKITDCHMNWEMGKLCWWIDEKREEMASSGTISKKFRSEFQFSCETGCANHRTFVNVESETFKSSRIYLYLKNLELGMHLWQIIVSQFTMAPRRDSTAMTRPTSGVIS
jgi:hypothetical protein